MQPSCLNKHGQLSRKSTVASQSVEFTSLHKLNVYSVYLITSPYGVEHITERGSNLSMFLPITYPTQERLATPPRSTPPTLFKQWRGFFYVPQEPDK